MNKYLKEYKWSNIFAMIRNLKLDPKICTDDFRHRLVIITGATSGIGYATARKYASHGADILCINRNEKNSKELCKSLASEFSTKCSYLIADFSKLSDVHAVGKQLTLLDRNINVVIHNAGVYITNKTLTEDNIETVFQTNYLSAFILNYYLREKLKKQNSGRFLFVNSEAHRFAVSGIHLDDLSWDKHHYSGLKSYSAAKMAQLLSMIIFNDYFQGTSVTVNAMHPGNVRTNSGQNNGERYKLLKRVFVDRTARSADISAEALYYLGVSAELEAISGKFFNLTTLEEPAPPALDKEAAEKLWMISLKLGVLMEIENNKIVIVGAGMAGLTAAAYLSRKNFNVLLLDKNDRTGGLLSTFENNGFFFDSGPRAFMNSGIVKPILKDLGIHWEFLENKISIGIEDQLVQVNSMEDLQKYKQILIHLYPDNEDDIEKIISFMYQLSGYNKVLYEFDNPNFNDLMSDKKFVFRKLIPWTFKFLHALSKFNQFNMPMELFLKGLSKNQSLIDILIQHFFRKTPTYFALGYFYVYLDYFYPKGGTGALINLLRRENSEFGWGDQT